MKNKELSIDSSQYIGGLALTNENIRQYICQNATDQEIGMFLELCKKRDLNPFLKEAYLIKYDKDRPAQMVVSKDVILKKACMIPAYKGFEAGVVLLNELGVIVETSGIVLPKHTLIGGWCTVFRDGKEPLKVSVNISEYPQKIGKPATMIRKVAVAQAHRESFPDQLAQMYDEAEFPQDNPSIENSTIVDEIDQMVFDIEVQENEQDKCMGCSKLLPQDEKKFSLSRFGTPLCRVCQKTAVPR
jgi:phage recombination protein Bet